jgi:hypothetical protein
MVLPFAALPLATHLILVADGIPRFDIRATCRPAAAAATTIGRTLDSCIRDEREARDQLGKNWSQFRADDRIRCVERARLSPEPSYVELLTCLEVSRDARALRERAPTTSGSAR